MAKPVESHRSPLLSALGSLAFLVAVPGSLAVYVPWRLTGWRLEPPFLGWSGTRWLGAVLVVLGGAALFDCFARFALQGLGTPAPLAPPERLVVSGLYRHVRNPMYVAVVTLVMGQALILGTPSLLLYAAAGALMFLCFVLLYEEPVLRARFGRSYETYCAAVPRFLPRLSPWRPE